MFESKASAPKRLEMKSDGPVLDTPPPRRPASSRQHQLMVGALVLLLAALGMLLYNDRDFWFPDTQDAEDALPAPANSITGSTHAVTARRPVLLAGKKQHASKPQAKDFTAAHPASEAAPPPVIATRTVLPPLQIEVVAGNVHRAVHPGTNAVHVDLQPGSVQAGSAQAGSVQTGSALSDSAQPDSQAQAGADSPIASGTPDTAAGVTRNASENVQMSADTSEIVSHSVRPGYPLLARQMKVQGSVILQALINRDGSIQDLHVLAGPPILASAAQEAVRQWRFKPHFQGAEPVETQAKITVNFTISTN
jgi:TonB family protein